MTAVDHAELKPCPFCGGPAHMQFSKFELHSGFHVVCHGKKDCPLYCSDPYRAHDSKEQAASVWNVRVHDAALLSEIEGLKAERDALEDVACTLRSVSCDLANAEPKWANHANDLMREALRLESLRTQAPDSWRPDREAVDTALKLATEGADKAGCDGWRSQEKCRQIVQLLTKALRPQTAESGK